MSTHVSHRDVWYTGKVQGVGFTAQVIGLARGFEVTGYVRDLDDGRIYLHAEGTDFEVESFSRQIARNLGGHIRGEEIRTFAGRRTCESFSIR